MIFFFITFDSSQNRLPFLSPLILIYISSLPSFYQFVSLQNNSNYNPENKMAVCKHKTTVNKSKQNLLSVRAAMRGLQDYLFEKKVL